MDKYNQQIGRAGENAAVKYLRKNKYKILEQNFYIRGGELDIVAEKDGCVVFVEVKTRSQSCFGSPLEAVDKRKQSRVIKAAQVYMQKNNINNVRIDVIGVNCSVNGEKIKVDSIEHIINAF